MSRSGSPRELLKGPLAYGVVFVLGTVVSWRTSVDSIFAFVLLCVGDGFAEIFGRRYGRGALGALPFNRRKTYAGSLAFVVLSLVAAELLYLHFYEHGFVSLRYSAFERRVRFALVCLAGAVAEGAVNTEWDNIVVYVAGAAAAYVIL
jgi:farnesol kinase